MTINHFEKWLNQILYQDFIRAECFRHDPEFLAKEAFNHAIELSAKSVDDAPKFGRREHTAKKIRSIKA